MPPYGAPKRSRKPTVPTNVSNTGTRQVSTSQTGASGSVSNTVNSVSTHGQTGAAGHASTYDFDMNGHIAAAHKMAGERVGDAFDRAEGHLAQVRQQALGAVPAEHRDRVNAHFDKASAQIGEMRKKFKG